MLSKVKSAGTKVAWVSSLVVCFLVAYFSGSTVLSKVISPKLLRDAGYHKYKNGEYLLEIPGSRLGLTEIGRGGGRGRRELESVEIWVDRGGNCEVVAQNKYFEEGAGINLVIGESGSLGQYTNFYGTAELDLRALHGSPQKYRYVDQDLDGNIDLILRCNKAGAIEFGKLRVEEQWVEAVLNEHSGVWEVK